MVETFNTKRPHRKSRGGCSTCKAKKIKCDEAQPKCNFCAARNLTCHYGIRPTTPKPTPPGSSQSLVAMTPKNSPPSIDFCKTMGNVSPSITSMPGVSSIEDLRLMHHYSTFVWNSVSLGDFSDTNDVLRITTPQLAFEYDFLMKTLLAFSSAHRRRLLPGSEPARLQTSIYHAQALSSFRRVVGQVKSDSPNYQAVLMVALLLSILTCTDDRKEGDELVIIEVLGLWRGLSNLMMITTPSFIETIPIFPIFRREFSPLKLEPIVPTELIQMLAAITPSDPEFHDLEHYCKALDAMGRVYAGLRQDGLTPSFFIRVISWPTVIPDGFVMFAKERRPRALIICAYYLAFIHLVQGVWWVEGLAEREIGAISKILGQEWQRMLAVPFGVLQRTSPEEKMNFMLQ